ncbi:unnamed protein product, partial [Phaeothamnion confervicola]
TGCAIVGSGGGSTGGNTGGSTGSGACACGDGGAPQLHRLGAFTLELLVRITASGVLVRQGYDPGDPAPLPGTVINGFSLEADVDEGKLRARMLWPAGNAAAVAAPTSGAAGGSGSGAGASGRTVGGRGAAARAGRGAGSGTGATATEGNSACGAAPPAAAVSGAPIPLALMAEFESEGRTLRRGRWVHLAVVVVPSGESYMRSDAAVPTVIMLVDGRPVR